MKQTLALQTGRIQRPQKAVIYGPEGIGKSTLASQFPAPVFLDTEGGTHHLDVTRLPVGKGWEDVTEAIVWLGRETHDFKTLVVDTADWLEKLLVEFICQRDNKTSVEDFGYGKGYVILAEEFTKFLASLDSLLSRGMHVVLLAHCRIVKFEQPEAAGAYDRYELKLTKQVAPLLREWCDMQLFANYFTRVAENESGKKRGVGGRERVLYTCHTAAWDAKNRHGFEEKFPFAFASIASAFGATAPVQKQPPIDKLAELFSGKEEAVNAFLLSRSQIKQGQTWHDLPSDYKARVLAAPERFMQTVEQFQSEAAQ